MPKTGNMAMTRQQVSEFEKANAQLGGLFEEISALSRKSPDSAVNKFKLKLINHCWSRFLQRYASFQRKNQTGL